jgi:hypothetical protein
MPNGEYPNWTRLRAAVGGFFVRHGHWPRRIRIFPGAISDLRTNVFSEAAFARIQEKLALIPDEEGAFIVEDEEGGAFVYGSEGMIPGWYGIDVAGWLGVDPHRRHT